MNSALLLEKLFHRDLEKLKEELSAFSQDTDLWVPVKGISNPPGNLCLHIIGNLRHFIGHVLGGSAFIRDRKKEFETPFLTRKVLYDQIDLCFEEISSTLKQMDATKLEKTYPLEVLGESISTSYFLMHLYGHLQYHLGQINYYRRLA
jgi:hypothetical protein